MLIIIAVLCNYSDVFTSDSNRIWGSYLMSDGKLKDYYCTINQLNGSRIVLNNIAGEGLSAEGQIEGGLVTFDSQMLGLAYGGQVYFHGWMSLEAGRYEFSFVPQFEEQAAVSHIGLMTRL